MGVYNVGVSTPLVNLGHAYGGSLNAAPQGGKAMDPRNFGSNPRGYTTHQAGAAYGTGWGASIMYSTSRTWVNK